MAAYKAPLRDFQFLINELVDFDAISKLPGYEEFADISDAVLEEAGNFASNVLDPLNAVGDREGAKRCPGCRPHGRSPGRPAAPAWPSCY